MRTKPNWMTKTLSAAILTVMLFNSSALPLSSAGGLSNKFSGAPPGESPIKAETPRVEEERPPLNIDDIKLPSTDKNPYSPEIDLNLYPIYNEVSFNMLTGRTYDDDKYNILTKYQIFDSVPDGHSPYVTAAITPWFTYEELTENGEVQGKLPYSEGRDNMLFPGLVLVNQGIIFSLTSDSSNGIAKGSFKDIVSSYMEENHHINTDQVYVRVGATLLSGKGMVYVSTSTGIYSESERVADEPIHIYVDVPLSKIDQWASVRIDCGLHRDSTDGVMTDLYVTLIDNQEPTLNSAKLDMIVDEKTKEAELTLELQFNEGLRFASEHVSYEFDDLWVELELLDLDTRERHKVKLFLERLDESGKLFFRGDIGYFHYRNFRVNRVSDASFAHQSRRIQRGFVDLADEFMINAYNKTDYNNAIHTDGIDPLFYSAMIRSTAIIDHAGNSINRDAIVNWQFGNQQYISNTFEAHEVRLFNEITLKNTKALSEGVEIDADLTDQFVGPSRSLIAYVYLKQKLTDEEISKLWITFNIRDKNGEELKGYSTSWSEYEVDELYSHGVTTGTLVRFEGIKLEEGMSFMEGGDGMTVKITGMYGDIPNKTVYPFLPDSVTDIYADFDAPKIALEKYASYSNVEPPSDGEEIGEHYKVSVKINVKDDDHLERYAGLIGNKMFVKLGAGVEQDTAVRYVFGSDPTPPEDLSGYTGEAVISKNGYADVGSGTLINQSTDFYLHLLFESTGVALDDIYINVNVEDAVGNCAELDPSGTVDYMIDGIAPTISFEYRNARSIDENTKIELKVGISATDTNDVIQLLYSWSKDPEIEGTSGSLEWNPVVFERGSRVAGEITRVFGDELASQKSGDIYSETLWIKSVDEYGNESEPVSIPIVLSVEKPATNMRFEGDYNAVSRNHTVTVKGPEASALNNLDAYTRVSITPITNGHQNAITSYVTLVKTGEEVNVLGFTGLTWYKVTRIGDIYAEVSDPETVGEYYTLSEDSIMYGLFTHYGEIKISFENGYGNMLPVQGEAVYNSAADASYSEDPNYLTLRFASPYDSERVIHTVDFGAIIDRDDKTVVEDAEKGADPYLYLADTRDVNPMRNTQIHFNISNLANSEYGMLDLDFEGSYAELFRVGVDGDDDVLISTMTGFAASDSQYFTIFNTADNGDYFVSGAYYLKVTLKSRGGHLDSYESSRIVLDAEIGETSGVWSYWTQNYSSLESIISETYTWTSHSASDKPFDNIGVSVTVGGEILRNRSFAAYTYGVSGLSITLDAPDSEKTFEGITVGKVAGFRIWNLLSEPTNEELAAAGFMISSVGDYLSKTNGLSEIYTEENIPKGAVGFEELYLVKGVNTICYQVLMENGYVSPIRQFNITVSDYTPELNIAIESYQPSYYQSSNTEVLNVDHIRYFIESAYSLNGSGNVEVEIWSDYGMYVGIDNGQEIVRSFVGDPSEGYLGELGLLEVPGGKLKVGDYVELTENSYTSDFPKYTHLCSAVFVARDEYGGVTIVAPQIGDHPRVDVSGGVYGWEVYNIDYYSDYYDDPYLIDDNFLSWRNIYNEPLFFGRELLGFESYVEKNTELGGEKYADITDGSASLKYNLFNIVTNDISWGFAEEYSEYDEFGDPYYRPYSNIIYNDGENYELIYWDGATITFTGGDLGDESVTLDLSTGNEITSLEGHPEQIPNTIGYMGANVHSYSDGTVGFSMDIAFPQATADMPAGTKITRQYVIRCNNRYGDSYKLSGNITLYTVDYDAAVTMNESGAKLELSFFTREYGDSYRSGNFNSGSYTFTATDYYGNAINLPYEISQGYDPKTQIVLSETKDTPKPVTITLTRADGVPIHVDITDHEIMSVENNGTYAVSVTLTDSTSFSFRYLDPISGNEIMKVVRVDNIKTPNPKIVWSYDDRSVLTDENGNRFLYGEVTAYLVDENYSLRDKFSGRAPQFTFTPDGQNSFVFVGAQLEAVLGDESVDLEENYSALLSVSLRELPDPLGFGAEDTETPSVQVLTYTDQNGYYSNSGIALKLEAARGMSSLPNYRGTSVIEFSGERANMQKVLDAIGWGTAFRFEIQTEDRSRVKLFIKEGLYASAPDYSTGYSDSIPGVELNSKLLTVTKNAEFSLFVVDAYNNSVSIAFNVNNIGEAPVPKVVKVDLGDGIIRGYLFPPDGATGFDIVGGQDVKIDSDSPSSSEYFGKYFVEYTKNDDYIINYRFTYNSKTIDGEVRVSVTEIVLDEIALIDNDQPIWSENKGFEATPLNVTASATLTKEIEEIRIAGEYDETRVSFFISGNVLTATFSDNHPAVEILCFDAEGNHVTVRFDAVDNIDRSAPIIEEVSRTLSSNGRELTLTLSSNERALFKEGGYIGEKHTDENGNTIYYYTVTIRQNGEYSYSFTDMSGLITRINVTVSEIISEPLEILYSTSYDGTDPKDDPSELDVMIGDKIFVKPNRDATLEMSGGVTQAVKAGTWNEIIIPDSVGGILPYVIVTDVYGNVITHQFGAVKVPDTTPPEIIVNKKIYSIRVGTTREEIEAELLRNFVAFDDMGGEVTLSVKFTENIDTVGISEVEYTATDKDGNSATVKEKLRISSIYEPVVKYGDARVDRSEGIIISAGEDLVLSIDCNGASYMVKIKAGNRTEAQMKDGSTLVTDYTTENTVSIGSLEKGLYTICIITTERDYFKIIVSVE